MTCENDQKIQNRHFDEKETPVADAAPRLSTQLQSPSEAKREGLIESHSGDHEPRDLECGQHDPPADPPSEEAVQRVQSAGEDYSVLTVTQKRWVVTVASLASIFSPMATAIYCEYLTLNLSLEIADSHRSIPRYHLQRPQCFKHEDQHHDHTLPSMFQCPCFSESRSTFHRSFKVLHQPSLLISQIAKGEGLCTSSASLFLLQQTSD